MLLKMLRGNLDAKNRDEFKASASANMKTRKQLQLINSLTNVTSIIK